MKIMVNRKGDQLMLKLAESIDISCIQEAKEKLGPILEMGRDMVVDLSALAEIDTAAVQLLMLFKRDADRRGIGCQFVHPGDAVAEILEFFHLPGLLVGPVAHP